MHGAWFVTLTALAAAVTVTTYELEDLDAVEEIKARILAGLGMERPPDLSSMNISKEYMQRKTRRYFRNLRLSEQELQKYNQTGFNKDNYFTVKPKLEYLSGFQRTKHRFPNSTSVDILSTVKNWKINLGDVLQNGCHERRCKKAKLGLVRRPRSNLSVCNRGCCRRSLKISFKEIGWNWIVQPVEFEAYYCKGRCRNVSHDFASTHALMQSILRKNGRKVTRTSCVPRKLESLDLLHYNDKSPPELVVTRQKSMIVKKCSCA